jgi:uncharacterized protein YraI
MMMQMCGHGSGWVQGVSSTLSFRAHMGYVKYDVRQYDVFVARPAHGTPCVPIDAQGHVRASFLEWIWDYPIP